MNDLELYLDLDGVCVDLLSSALKILNIDIKNVTMKGWRIEQWQGVNVSEYEFWTAIDKVGHSFWENLSMFNYTLEMVRHFQSLQCPLYFCTSQCRDPFCSSGKMAWIEKHFPEMRRNVFLTPQKHKLAAPNRILIDDKTSNIQKWREAGGIGVLFPQPYNSSISNYGTRKSFEIVKKEVDKVVEEIRVVQNRAEHGVFQ